MELELKSVELKHLVTLFLLCLVENTAKDYDFRDIIISIDPEGMSLNSLSVSHSIVFARNTKVLVTPSTVPTDYMHREVLAELASKSLQIIKVLCSKNAFGANLKLKKKYQQYLQQCQAYCAHQVAFIEVQQEDPNSDALDTVCFSRILTSILTSRYIFRYPKITMIAMSDIPSFLAARSGSMSLLPSLS
jgi:hypothetical protein